MPFPFPEELLHRGMLLRVVAWINTQPVLRPKVRKYMIIEWCRLVDEPLTSRIVAMVYRE